MTRLTAGQLIAELNEVLASLVTVYVMESEYISDSLSNDVKRAKVADFSVGIDPDLTSDEQAEVIELGKRLAEYHRYGTRHFHKDACGGVQEFATWLESLDASKNPHDIVLTSLITLMFGCFGIQPVESIAIDVPPSEESAGYAIYRESLKCKRSSQVFEAFVSNRLPGSQSSIRWPSNLVNNLLGVHYHRIARAERALHPIVVKHSHSSPFVELYGKVLMSIGSLLTRTPICCKRFCALFDKLCRYHTTLELYEADVVIKLDRSGRVVRAKPDRVSGTGTLELHASSGSDPVGATSNAPVGPTVLSSDQPCQGRVEKIAKLPEKQRLAILAFDRARDSLAVRGKSITKHEAYQWCINFDEEFDATTWTAFERSLSRARSALGEQVREPRGGRGGRSIVPQRTTRGD